MTRSSFLMAAAALALLSGTADAGHHRDPHALASSLEHRTQQLLGEVQTHFGRAPCFHRLLEEASCIRQDACLAHRLLDAGQVHESRNVARRIEERAERLDDIVGDIDDDDVHDDCLDRVEDLIGDIDDDAENLESALKNYRPIVQVAPAPAPFYPPVTQPIDNRRFEPGAPVAPNQPYPPTYRGYPPYDVYSPRQPAGPRFSEPTYDPNFGRLQTVPTPSLHNGRGPAPTPSLHNSGGQFSETGPLIIDPRFGTAPTPGTDEPYVESGPVIRGRMR